MTTHSQHPLTPDIGRQPAIYLSHGGGPCFWTDLPEPFGPHAFDKLRVYLAGLISALPALPKAILIVTAHWEATVPTISTATAPPMLFDYYGFPEHTYHLKYPAPGAPKMALRAQDLLKQTGIKSATDAARGYDHGVFVPMLIVDPEAQIPIVMMSLQKDLDPATHIAIGKALAPLRDEGVLIIGSGSSYHNLGSFFGGSGDKAAAEFDAWLNHVVTTPDASERNAGLVDWAKAPSARAAHPREEHLLPLMVVAGAAGNDGARRSFSDVIGGKAVSCFSFGA